jgi:hypothetical protein
MLKGPLPHRIKIPTLMLSIEIWKRKWLISIPPYLPKNSDVDGAHQLLAKDIEAMGFNSHIISKTLEFEMGRGVTY